MIILIGGPSAVGKTSLANMLSERLSIPVISKDSIKEILFESLGAGNMESTRLYREPSWRLFYFMMEKFIVSHTTCIFEGNFKAGLDESELLRLRKKHSSQFLQIFCTANVDTLVNRFFERNATNRHPGHNGHLVDVDALKKGILREMSPLELGSTLIEVDMNSFEDVNYEGLIGNVAELLGIKQ